MARTATAAAPIRNGTREVLAATIVPDPTAAACPELAACPDPEPEATATPPELIGCATTPGAALKGPLVGAASNPDRELTAVRRESESRFSRINSAFMSAACW